MNDMRIDSSLAEVRRWREQAQQDLSHLNSESAIKEVHRRSEEFMQTHGLDLRAEKREPVKA
jgi:hypothetical protein